MCHGDLPWLDTASNEFGNEVKSNHHFGAGNRFVGRKFSIRVVTGRKCLCGILFEL